MKYSKGDEIWVSLNYVCRGVIIDFEIPSYVITDSFYEKTTLLVRQREVLGLSHD